MATSQVFGSRYPNTENISVFGYSGIDQSEHA